MEIQSIFASKALPEAGLDKNVVIDAHRYGGSRIHLRHPSAGRSVLQDHSSEPSQTLASYTRDSVRRRAASLCAGHAQQLGGESPLADLMEVRPSDDARATAARRGLKEGDCARKAVELTPGDLLGVASGD